jgi:hypothetical protein
MAKEGVGSKVAAAPERRYARKQVSEMLYREQRVSYFLKTYA